MGSSWQLCQVMLLFYTYESPLSILGRELWNWLSVIWTWHQTLYSIVADVEVACTVMVGLVILTMFYNSTVRKLWLSVAHRGLPRYLDAPQTGKSSVSLSIVWQKMQSIANTYYSKPWYYLALTDVGGEWLHVLSPFPLSRFWSQKVEGFHQERAHAIMFNPPSNWIA